MLKQFFFLTIIGIGLSSCSTNSLDDHKKDRISGENGLELMKNQCFSCHNTQGSDKILAPPMFRVKDHYGDENISRDEFISDIVNWVMDPKEENSVMPGARRKFGLMPKQNFNKTDVEEIAAYMFDNELTHESCAH